MKNDQQTSKKAEKAKKNYKKESTSQNIESERKKMTRVIKSYNRPDFYYICSDELKKDYDFVLFLLDYIRNVTLDSKGKIRVFPIITVANGEQDAKHDLKKDQKTYINNVGEVNKLLCAIISNVVNEDAYKKKRKQVFSIASEAIKVLDSSYKVHTYCNEICKLELKLASQRTNDFKLKAQNYDISLGLGFYYIRCSYNHYDNLLEKFAKIFIEKIFSRDNLSIENELHKEFYSKEHMLQYGVYNYLLNYIARCDLALYEYLKLRRYLLKDKAETLIKYAENWDKYVYKEKAKSYRLVFKKVREYINDCYYEESVLSELDIMAYVVKELDLPQSIFCYDESGYIMTRDVLKNLNYEYIESQIKNSKRFVDRRKYYDIKRIFIETLNLGFKTDNKFTNPTFSSARNDLFLKKETTSRCRIITYDFKNKKLK